MSARCSFRAKQPRHALKNLCYRMSVASPRYHRFPRLMTEWVSQMDPLTASALGQQPTSAQRRDRSADCQKRTYLGTYCTRKSKSKDTRYLDIHEDDQLDEAQLAAWVKQASRLPGERMERESRVRRRRSRRARRHRSRKSARSQSRPSSQAATLRSRRPTARPRAGLHLAAMPGWKREVGRRLDALIVRTVPGVRKAFKDVTHQCRIGGEGLVGSERCDVRDVLRERK